MTREEIKDIGIWKEFLKKFGRLKRWSGEYGGFTPPPRYEKFYEYSNGKWEITWFPYHYLQSIDFRLQIRGKEVPFSLYNGELHYHNTVTEEDAPFISMYFETFYEEAEKLLQKLGKGRKKVEGGKMIEKLTEQIFSWFKEMKFPKHEQAEGFIKWTLLFLLKTPEGQKFLAEYLRDNPLKVKFTGDGEDVDKGSGHN